jgi:hypothetical protein
MTDDHPRGYQTKVSPVLLHRMVTEYEKRGLTTSHLAAAFEAHRAHNAPPSPAPVTPSDSDDAGEKE